MLATNPKLLYHFFFMLCLYSILVQACSAPTSRLAQKQAAFPTSKELSITVSPSLSITPTPYSTQTQTPTSTPIPSQSPSYTPLIDPLNWLHSTQLGNYLKIQSTGGAAIEENGWRIYEFPLSETGCVFGEKFFVLVRSGSDPMKTVFWMNGGGACWPGQEACANHFNLDRWNPESKLASQDKDNPVKDWNFIFVPSCDGSFFMGDHQADYSKDGKADHTHWGLRNTSAGTALVKSLFPETQKILIAGCSAGGYGTLIAAPLFRLQFPNASIYVFNESGPGLFDPAQAKTWQDVQDAWGLEAVLPVECPRCRDQLIYLYSWMLEHDPKFRAGLFSSYQDSVIGNIYLGMSSSAFKNLLLSTTNEIHSTYPDTFKRYFIQGSAHCVTDYNRQLEGVSIFDWIAALIQEKTDWIEVLE